MSRSILSLAVVGVLMILGLVAVSAASGQIPPGYEVVHITDNPADYSGVPRINNCGEVVFSTRINQLEYLEEIFLYDNGKVARVTRDNIEDAFPDINDQGTIVWTHDPVGDAGGTVFMYRDGTITEIATGFAPTINNLGHMAWQLREPQECPYAWNVFFYDGESIQQITDDGFANQAVEINDQDQLVWTRYDLCADPWESDIMLYSGGVTTQLTDGQVYAQMPHINNLGQVAWRSLYEPGQDQIELWEDGQTVVLTEWGYNPRLNNEGQMAFIRWHDETSTWDAWFCPGCVTADGGDPTLLRLTHDPSWNIPGDINDYGEVVWESGIFPEMGVFFLRRVRNGDLDLDQDVDLDDLRGLQGCMTGPLDTDRLCDCRFLDYDHDRDVDLTDFSTFQNLFTAEE